MSFTALTGRYHDSSKPKLRQVSVKGVLNSNYLMFAATQKNSHRLLLQVADMVICLSGFISFLCLCCIVIWEGGCLDSNLGLKHMVTFLKAIVLLADGLGPGQHHLAKQLLMKAAFKSPQHFQIVKRGFFSFPAFAHMQSLTSAAERGLIGTRAKSNRRKYINQTKKTQCLIFFFETLLEPTEA